MTDINNFHIIGWREWVSLPELGLARIKAKCDTGAKTSVLHAFLLEPFKQNGKHMIHFSIHPLQRTTEVVHNCTAEIIDIRWISDSGGHIERRYVIQSQLVIGATTKNIEITLTNRDSMRFRMLLGRSALKDHFLINPNLSYTNKKTIKL